MLGFRGRGGVVVDGCLYESGGTRWGRGEVTEDRWGFGGGWRRLVVVRGEGEGTEDRWGLVGGGVDMAGGS